MIWITELTKQNNEKTVLWYDFDEYKYNNIDMSATGVHVSTDALELKEAEGAQVSAAIAPYYAKGRAYLCIRR